MAALPEDELSKAEGMDAGLALALDWASKTFGFDPQDRHSRQPGVESLQKSLVGEGFDVVPDGILGRQTIAALERTATANPDPNTLKAEPGSYTTKGGEVRFTTSKIAPDSDGLSSALDETDQAGTKEDAEDEPGVTPEDDDDDYNPESQDKDSEREEVTARPVALSDSAIEDIGQDRLGFRPYVEAVAEFILAEQTRPPLAIAINARWGQGKTSFMNMLDGQLKQKAPQTTMRVGTTWFNPWKYSEPEQVWAAFIANVTRCVRDNLTREQSWHFRWDRFRSKLHRHADLPMVLRLAVAFLFVLLVLTLPFTMDLAAFHATFNGNQGILGAFYAATENIDGWLWTILFVPFALLSVLYGYITFSKGLGLNLLEYVEKTDFKDKIGTLSQFESEMRRLADAVPEDLKVVVFIDDLDRCRGKVLGEIIEALQLADVSRTCIFVMGMDMQIVARAIESERGELTASTGGVAHMEHGSGYKFLEKIIQARLALPTHGEAEMAQLVASAMGSDDLAAPDSGRESSELAGQATESKPEGILQTTFSALAGRHQPPVEPPSDSKTVIDTAEHYGSRHFNNPRRLKRFINGFRLQAYLANAVRPATTDVDRLARFLVLAEKWPALLHHLVQENKGAEILDEPMPEGTAVTMAMEIDRLRKEDRECVIELLLGREGSDPLTAAQVRSLAAWCGFFYYSGIVAKKADS